MSLQKHDIPILEYDPNPAALLRHDRQEDIRFPKRAVFAFLGDKSNEYAAQQDGVILDVFHTITGDTPIYGIRCHGQMLCLCKAPLGSASAVQLMDWLIGHGVESIVAVGSCGALVPLPEGHFLIPVNAMRDEGASYHYLPPQRYVDTSKEVREAICSVLRANHMPYLECTTWTTDGFFRETQDMVDYRREEGCAVVEMECAGMAACAQFRGTKFGQLLYTADTLAGQQHDERGWGMDFMDLALKLALDAAAFLP